MRIIVINPDDSLLEDIQTLAAKHSSLIVELKNILPEDELTFNPHNPMVPIVPIGKMADVFNPEISRRNPVKGLFDEVQK